METLHAREVRIPLAEGTLLGDLCLPPGAHAAVVFVDGHGLGRHAPEDRAVARHLAGHGIGSLMLDLLTCSEQQAPPHPGHHGPDLPRLTHRILEAITWLAADPALQGTTLALCGLGAGSAAALIAAGRLGTQVGAVVALGGRADQAGPSALASIRAPTLLLAGSRDAEAVASHDAAYQHLRCERSLAVVPGGGALLDQPGVLAHAAEMAADWFAAHLPALAEAG
ncbi:dienelactone hydrolase family protein [Ramlibacter sp. MAHUQ-53]|uniref:dienelactone hydrolase family protein n=1 Tax=unclassified Ramlibacter TaxID=2617605 RepID=UPI00364184A9